MKIFLHMVAYLHMLMLLALVGGAAWTIHEHKVEPERFMVAFDYLKTGNFPEKPPPAIDGGLPAAPASVSEEMLRRKEYEVLERIDRGDAKGAVNVALATKEKLREFFAHQTRELNQKIQEWRALRKQYDNKQIELDRLRDRLVARENDFNRQIERFNKDKADEGITEIVATIRTLDPEDAYREIKHVNNPWKLYLIFARLANEFRAELLLQFVQDDANTISKNNLPDEYKVYAGAQKGVVIEEFLSAGGFPLINKFDPPSRVDAPAGPAQGP